VNAARPIKSRKNKAVTKSQQYNFFVLSPLMMRLLAFLILTFWAKSLNLRIWSEPVFDPQKNNNSPKN